MFARAQREEGKLLSRTPGLIGSSIQAAGEDPLTWFSRAVGKLRTLWLARTYPFASFGKGAWVHYSCRVARSAAQYISIGENVGLGSGCPAGRLRSSWH